MPEERQAGDLQLEHQAAVYQRQLSEVDHFDLELKTNTNRAGPVLAKLFIRFRFNFQIIDPTAT